jgi:5-methylcytosine-specific restriction protein A
MAVTKGHGNPKWTREELILALDLYFQTRNSLPGPKDQRVIALSRELRSLPYHAEAARKQSFRNPDGVAFKLQNLRQVATGQGLSNTSKADREIWEHLGDDPGRTRIAAARVRAGIKIAGQSHNELEEHEFIEGRAVTQAHRRIERNRRIRKRLLDSRLDSDGLACDMCAMESGHLPIELRTSVFEAHHRVPISAGGPTKTKISDMALLCANCHRLLHRLIATTGEWVDVPGAAERLYGTGKTNS